MAQLQLVIKTENSSNESKLFFNQGESLLLLCQKAGIEIAVPCGGKGICGKCRVQFLKGAPLPTLTERQVLSPGELRKGIRLACISKLTDNCEILLPEAKKANVIGSQFVINWPEQLKDDNRFMIATDIGTTTLVMEKRRICDGKVVNVYKAVNKQIKYGADVMSRLEASVHGKKEALQKLILEQLEDGLTKLGIDNAVFMVLAANTSMVHLLMGYDVEELCKAPFVPHTLEQIETTIGGLKTHILPGYSAFVGGDIYAGLLAVKHIKNIEINDASNREIDNQIGCKMNNGNNDSGIISLFIDLGTNAEMVIFDDQKMIATAAAAGSAFDAIADIQVFGADMIAMVHQFIKDDLIDTHGTIKEPYFETGIKCNINSNEVYINQVHIRELQLAKAAVRCGIEYLVQEYGCTLSDVKHIYLAGGFGYYLDVNASIAVGLLPNEFADKTISCGNTALVGAAVYGMNILLDKENDLWEGKNERVINLANEPNFSNNYIDYIDL